MNYFEITECSVYVYFLFLNFFIYLGSYEIHDLKVINIYIWTREQSGLRGCFEFRKKYYVQHHSVYMTIIAFYDFIFNLDRFIINMYSKKIFALKNGIKFEPKIFGLKDHNDFLLCLYFRSCNILQLFVL